MIQRQRGSSGEAEAVSRPARASPTPGHAERPSPARPQRSPVWEDLYRAVSAEQQRELLALAEGQGILYAHQLPVTGNGSAVDQNAQLFARILGGAVADLLPLLPEPVPVGDSELDAAQREAVARALATPDILLVQGPPGSGKSRLAAEIIASTAARGERALLLAPTSAAIDRVLGWTAARDVVFALRCVDRDENVAALPAAIRALTFTERVCAATVHALERARHQAEADEQRARRLPEDEPLWPQLEELANQWENLEDECQALEKQRSGLAAEVAKQAKAAAPIAADGFARWIADLTRSHEEARVHAGRRLGELRGKLEAGEQERKVLDSELRGLQPLVDAKQQGQWWTGAWWRATLRGKSTMTRWAQCHQRCQELQAARDALREQISLLTRQWEEAESVFGTRQEGLIAAEVARRQVDLDRREAVLRREQNVLQQQWQMACQRLAPDSPRPVEMRRQAVQVARSEWCRQVQQSAAQAALARQWAVHLEQAPAALADRLPGYVNLVAATMTALPRDEHFGDGVPGKIGSADFDLLVLEEADQITEAEFLHAARRARRCVLIGEKPWPWESDTVSRRHSTTVPERKGASSELRSWAATLPRTGVFQRLWQILHCDPRQLPYAWTQEKNRLCCHLRPVASERRQWIAVEHVADFPDIELRILTVPGCQPVLAEIVFPPSFSIDRAKQYIFQELQELAVQPSGTSLRWVDQEDRLVLRLADRDLAHGLAIELMPGIREILGTGAEEQKSGQAPMVTWQTCCLEFDRSAGWDRPRAAQWVQEHLGLRDLGRTACLDVCYRMEPSLAAFVSDFLSVGASARGQTAPSVSIQAAERNGWSTPVEFVPVPTLPEAEGAQQRRATDPGQRRAATVLSTAHMLPRKGGAGLEIDLAEPRHRDRLPAELRAELPTRGFVNYAEAQAVVRTLAHLLKEFGPGQLRQSSGQSAVVILALYPGQAELIRQLLRQDPSLAALGEQVECTVPAAFRQREAALVLLSLTRSHTHRAVAFGQGPETLALAMTRARSKLVVFGDPGTLVRRSQWDGPLEHLGEEAAARERQLISRLVHSLQSNGFHLQAAPVDQGSGP